MSPGTLSRRNRLRRLAQLIVSSEENTEACDQCRERLPDYIDAESEGRDASQLYPEVRQHLETCLACQEYYADQLAIARREATNELAQFAQTPRFDLSFLPQRSRDHAHLVYDFVEHIIRVVKPHLLEEVALIRERLLETFNGLVDQIPSVAISQAALSPELAFTDEIPAAQWAKATFIGLESVRARATRQEIEHLHDAGKLYEFLLPIAQDAAQQAKLGRQDASKFARAFAKALSEERWDELVSWMT